MISKPSSPRPRRSTRKRSAPSRFGFSEEGPNKRSRTASNQGSTETSLCDLPVDIISCCLSYVSSSSDRYAIQSTNKLFQNLSNYPSMKKNLDLLGNEESGKGSLLSEDDNPESAAKKLISYAKVGNLEAFYMLGILAIYAKDDMEAGLGLLREGSKEGCVRCKHEMGLLLRKNNDGVRRHDGIPFLEEAAQQGYLPSMLELGHRPPRKNNDEECSNYLSQIRSVRCLKAIIKKKPLPPRARWREECYNPYCIRPNYRSTVRANKWIKSNSLFSPQWMRLRPELMQLGQRSFFVLIENEPFRPPPMQCCALCHHAVYCSKSCQAYHWKYGGHKKMCRLLRGMN